MTDTDSLLVFRLQRLRSQPKTLRGRCILFYASLNEQPVKRSLLFVAFTVFVLVHLLWLSINLNSCYEDQFCGQGPRMTLLPLLLMSIYPLPFIVFILIILCKDIIVKKEGFMVWHRDSIGILVQRFLFSLIIMVSIVLFGGCVEDPDLEHCIKRTSIPLILILLVVTLKISCLRRQRIFLWAGFIVSLIAQFIILATADVKLAPGKSDPGSDANHVAQCLVFLPFLFFGLMVDIQILVSTSQYKPIAFKRAPCSCARPFMLTIGVLSLLMTVVAYVFCLLVFGGLNKDPNVRQAAFVCFIVKALTWSPFLALEYYDTLFEQIYHDVQFQLNFIKPNNSSRSTSPRIPNKNTSLSVIPEVSSNQPLLASEQENNDRSVVGTSGNEEDFKTNSQLFKPTSQQLQTMSADNKLGLKSSAGNAASILQVQPVELKTEQEITDMQKNRLVILQESGLTKSITDSDIDIKSRGNLNLTEYERQVRRANGLPSQLEPSNGNNNEQQDEEPETYGFIRFGSVDQQEEKKSGGPSTWGDRHGQPKFTEVQNGDSLIRKCSDYQRQMTKMPESGEMDDLLGFSGEFKVDTQTDNDGAVRITSNEPELSPVSGSGDSGKPGSGVSLNPPSLPASIDQKGGVLDV